MMKIICRERQFCKLKLLSIIWFNNLDFCQIIEQSFALRFEGCVALLLVVLVILQLKETRAEVISVKVKSYIFLCILSFTDKA